MNGDGYLDEFDVRVQYEYKVQVLQQRGEHRHQAQHDAATTWMILSDTILEPTGNCKKISTLAIARRPGALRVLYELLLGLRETHANQNFLA